MCVDVSSFGRGPFTVLSSPEQNNRKDATICVCLFMHTGQSQGDIIRKGERCCDDPPPRKTNRAGRALLLSHTLAVGRDVVSPRGLHAGAHFEFWFVPISNLTGEI